MIISRLSSAVVLTVVGFAAGPPRNATSNLQQSDAVQNAAGLRMLVAEQNARPTLRIVVPGHAQSDRSLEILFPEHVSVRRPGSATVEHLYRFQPGAQGDRPTWRREGLSLQYERELPGPIHLLARATLELDGVRFHYEFRNGSDLHYEMVYAVTDPRMTGMFHDVRLERTYVYRDAAFDLLASDRPERLTLPLDQWLPSRYLASYTWPVPIPLVERRDGITYYNASRRVDQPFIATLSTDRTWVIATFARSPGNVWSNPELTCQHADPQASLPPRQRVILEVKMLVLQGTLEDVVQAVVTQRGSLN